MSRFSSDPCETDPPFKNESGADTVAWKSAAEKEKDLLLQIYSSFGIDYDQMTGEYRVRL